MKKKIKQEKKKIFVCNVRKLNLIDKYVQQIIQIPIKQIQQNYCVSVAKKY